MNFIPSIQRLIRENREVAVLLFLSLVLRFAIAVNGGQSLFDSGQDAPTYLNTALDFNKFGWLSDQISALPVWPAGYPFLLSLFLIIGGANGWILLSIFQHLLFLSAVIYFVHNSRVYLNEWQRITLTTILFFIPSFLYSPSENMYESVLTSMLLIGLGACLHLFVAESKERYPILVAVLAFGFAGFLQAKTVPIGVLIFLILGFYKRRELFFYAPLMLWGLVLTVHRSFVAYGILSPSINYSIAIQVSGTKVPCEITSPLNLNPAQLGAEIDRQYILCSVKHFATHPADFLTHILSQARALFGPLDGGGLTGATTWFHGLSFQRIMGFFGFTDSNALFRIENVYALVLNLLYFIGFLVALRNFNRLITIAIASPIAVISIVHLLSDGDARYRLPFLPFQIVFVIIFFSSLRNWVVHRAKSAKL
jgi:hypothetical protein